MNNFRILKLLGYYHATEDQKGSTIYLDVCIPIGVFGDVAARTIEAYKERKAVYIGHFKLVDKDENGDIRVVFLFEVKK